MNQPYHDLLYRSLDGTLTPAEQAQLDLDLQESAVLRAERDELIQMRGLMENQTTPAFKIGFSHRIMQRLAAESQQNETDLFVDDLSYMFRRVALAASIAAILLVSYNLASSDTISLAASFGIIEPTLEDLHDVSMALMSEGAL